MYANRRHLLPILTITGCLIFWACDNNQLTGLGGDHSVEFESLASKGKPGPPISGTIYFSSGDLVYAMDGDGGNKRNFPAGVTGEPSREVHGGYRWFLHVEPVAGAYSDGVPREEVFATGAQPGNLDVITVQLTNDPNVHPRGSLRWSPGDSKVGFRGRRLDAAGRVIEGGLFVLDVEFTSGNPTPVLLPALVVATAISPREDWCEIGSGQVCEHSLLAGFDWSPGMDRIVYGDGSLGVIRIHGVRDLASGSFPRWSPATVDSPDGRIIFNVYACCLWTVSPDGSELQKVVEVRSGRNCCFGRYARRPHWSPTGEHFVYFWEELKLSSGQTQYKSRINRVEADGSHQVCLTCDFDYQKPVPLAWL